LEKVDTNTRKSTSQPDESAAADDKMANILGRRKENPQGRTGPGGQSRISRGRPDRRWLKHQAGVSPGAGDKSTGSVRWRQKLNQKNSVEALGSPCHGMNRRVGKSKNHESTSTEIEDSWVHVKSSVAIKARLPTREDFERGTMNRGEAWTLTWPLYSTSARQRKPTQEDRFRPRKSNHRQKTMDQTKSKSKNKAQEVKLKTQILNH
jgi:hypothetical protein